MKTLSVFDIAPSKDNQRNSEGDFIRLNDGSIIFVYSRFVGGDQDQSESQIAMYVSRDNGINWGEHRIIYHTHDFAGAKNIMSVSLLRMQDGAVGLFFIIRKSTVDARLHLVRSYDEGKTWSEPVCCIPQLGYFVTNNNRVIRTASGRILLPGNLHICKNELDNLDDESGVSGHGLCYFFHSDDDGKTWVANRDFCRLNASRSATGLQETGIIELEPGVIMAYHRTDLKMQYASFSYDDGITWTPVEPLIYFTSPESPMKIKKLDDGRMIAVWNPTPFYTGRDANWHTARSPLAVAFSSDNCKNWDDFELIETDKNSGYSYPAIFNDGDLLILGYCAGSMDDGSNLNRLRIRTIKL